MKMQLLELDVQLLPWLLRSWYLGTRRCQKTVKSHRSSWIWLLSSQNLRNPTVHHQQHRKVWILKLLKERNTHTHTHTHPKNSFPQICNPELVTQKVSNPKTCDLREPATNCRIKYNPLVTSPKFSSRNLHFETWLGEGEKKHEFLYNLKRRIEMGFAFKKFTSSVIFCRDGKNYFLQNLSQNVEIVFFFFFLQNARNAKKSVFSREEYTHKRLLYSSVQERPKYIRRPTFIDGGSNVSDSSTRKAFNSFDENLTVQIPSTQDLTSAIPLP
jgi:hypothetical protein